MATLLLAESPIDRNRGLNILAEVRLQGSRH